LGGADIFLVNKRKYTKNIQINFIFFYFFCIIIINKKQIDNL